MKLDNAICGIANEYHYRLDYIYTLYFDEFSMLCNYIAKKYKARTGKGKLEDVDKALITKMKSAKKAQAIKKVHKIKVKIGGKK